MVKVFLVVARHKAFTAGCRLAGTGFDLVLEQHVHEHVHGLGFDDQGASRALVAGVKVLVHAVVVNHCNVACFPVVANAVVNFLARSLQNAKGRFLHVTVLFSFCFGGGGVAKTGSKRWCEMGQPGVGAANRFVWV